MTLRDTRKPADYFSNLVVDFDEALQETQDALDAGNFKTPTSRVDIAQRLYQLSIMRAVAHYSHGTSIKALTPYVEAILPYRQQLSAIADQLPSQHQFYRDDFEQLGDAGDACGSANINRYVYVLWWLSLLVACDVETTHIKSALAIIGEQGKDTLLDNIAIALGDKDRAVSANLYYPEVYQPLSDAWNASFDEQRDLLNTFVSQWYENLDEADWYASDECDCEFEYTDYYIGYWCFEFALVINLLSIPLSPSFSSPVIPRDLI